MCFFFLFPSFSYHLIIFICHKLFYCEFCFYVILLYTFINTFYLVNVHDINCVADSNSTPTIFLYFPLTNTTIDCCVHCKYVYYLCMYAHGLELSVYLISTQKRKIIFTFFFFIFKYCILIGKIVVDFFLS